MHAVLLLAMFLPPVAATAPISPHPQVSNGSYMPIRGTIRREENRGVVDQRGVGLAGQIRQLDERIDHLRESGQISRREARQMRREARAIANAWVVYGSDGLSDSEASELQIRLFAASSLALPSRPPTGR